MMNQISPHSLQGQCPCPKSELTCKLEWKPVCDTRGKTHANMCEAYKAGALVDHHGQCSWSPCGRGQGASCSWDWSHFRSGPPLVPWTATGQPTSLAASSEVATSQGVSQVVPWYLSPPGVSLVLSPPVSQTS